MSFNELFLGYAKSRIFLGVFVGVFLISCTQPIRVPGKGKFLRVEISSGIVTFSRTDLATSSTDAEMECEFQDGSRLRAACSSFLALECPPARADPSISTESVARNISREEIERLPIPYSAQRQSPPKRIPVGRYEQEKANSSNQGTTVATFVTDKLPISFKIISKYGTSSEKKITLGVK